MKLLASFVAFVCLLVVHAAGAQTTWNPADKGSKTTLSNANRVASGLPGGPVGFTSARGTTSKIEGYFEAILLTASPTASVVIGVADGSFSTQTYPGASNNSAGVQWIYTATPQPFVSGVVRASAIINQPTSVAGDVFMVYVKNGDIWFGRNGVWSSGNPATGVSPNVTGFAGAVYPVVGTYDAANTLQLITAAPFTYTPPGAAWDNGSSPLWSAPAFNPYPAPNAIWRKIAGAEIYRNAGSPIIGVGPGMLSTCWSTPQGCVAVGPPFGEFWTVDVKGPPWNIPNDASYVDLEGVGGISGAGNFSVTYRAPGDTSVQCGFVPATVNNVHIQGLSEGTGHRSNGTKRVPIANGRFEVCWSTTTNCASCFWNPTIKEWGRDEP